MGDKIEISNDQFILITDKRFDENFWLYYLGNEVKDKYSKEDNNFSFDFYTVGVEQWQHYKTILQSIICEGKNPQPWVVDMLEGNLKDFITAFLTVLVSTYSIPLGLALPLVAMFLKCEVKLFCSQ